MLQCEDTQGADIQDPDIHCSLEWYGRYLNSGVACTPDMALKRLMFYFTSRKLLTNRMHQLRFLVHSLHTHHTMHHQMEPDKHDCATLRLVVADMDHSPMSQIEPLHPVSHVHCPGPVHVP